jgi:NAD(P)-dependent dehydrogenase (short-subunit alcohol dehydrogenase family)
VHDAIAAMLGTIAAEWGLGVAMGTRQFLPPDRALKMDILVRGAGIGGRFLAIDVTRREAPEDVDGARMDAADEGKETKYTAWYTHPVTVLAFAMDHRGRLSEDSQKVIDLLVAAGARMCGGHPDDLRRDLLVRLAAEVHHDLAFYYALTAAVSRCSAPGVPQLASLRIRGPLYRACPGYLRPRAQPRPPPWRKAS